MSEHETRPAEEYNPPMSPYKEYQEINAYVVGWGMFFAALFALAVGYLSLKIGQTVDAFAPVSVLAMGMAVLFKRKNAFPETVHIQAIASAGTNILGGTMFILPALFILHIYGVSYWDGHADRLRWYPRRLPGDYVPPLFRRRNGQGLSLPIRPGCGAGVGLQ